MTAETNETHALHRGHCFLWFGRIGYRPEPRARAGFRRDCRGLSPVGPVPWYPSPPRDSGLTLPQLERVMPPPNDNEWDDRKRIVEEQAAQIASKLNMIPLTRDEFLAGALAWIVEKEYGFDPERGMFSPWCYRVLYNHGVDVIRRSARDLDLKKEKRYETRRALARNARLDRTGPEPDEAPERDPADILEQHVAGEDRVLLAIDVCLLGRLTSDRVAAWLREAELPEDFAWQALEAIEKQANRRRALAAALGQDDGWLRQHIYRALLKIKKAEGVDL